MNIEDISNALPNGFHDAYIQRLILDYAKHEAVFELEIWVGDSDSKDTTKSDEYRSGRLKLDGFLFCVIEPPDVPFDERSVLEDGALWIADDSSDFGELKSYPLLPELSGGFRHW